jgi:hypothetical protein
MAKSDIDSSVTASSESRGANPRSLFVYGGPLLNYLFSIWCKLMLVITFLTNSMLAGVILEAKQNFLSMLRKINDLKF